MSRWYSIDRETKLPLPLPDDDRAAMLALEDVDRRVALTALHGMEVSTVFLGLDHNHHGGTPVLFETLVFGTGNSEWIDRGCRYHTWADAVAGHERFVAMIDYEVKHWKSPTSRNVREGRYLARRAKRATCN